MGGNVQVTTHFLSVEHWLVTSFQQEQLFGNGTLQKAILWFSSMKIPIGLGVRHKSIESSWRVFFIRQNSYMDSGGLQLANPLRGFPTTPLLDSYPPLTATGLRIPEDGSMWTQKSQMSRGCASAWQLLLTPPHIHGNCLSLNPSWMAAMLLSFGIWQKRLCRKVWHQQV